MAEWNIIKSTDLAEGWRFDAEYWRTVYLENVRTINASGNGGLHTSDLKRLVDRVTGSAFYPSFVGYYSSSGMPFLRVADLGELFLTDEAMVRIAEPVIRNHRQVSTIMPGDLVIAKGGSIGGACIVTDEYGESAVCRDVIAVQTNRSRLDPYYLAVFLNTRFGNLQLERNKSQQVQAHLTFPAVERIQVAFPDEAKQEAIRTLVIASHKAISDSKRSFATAQQIIESELGLDRLKFKKPVGYTAQFSEVESSRRLDAEHYFPAFKHFAIHLPKKITLTPLSKHLAFCQRGKQPLYGESGLPVINSKHVQPNRVVFEDNRHAAPGPLSELQIRTGDILMNGTGRGTLGRVAPYLAGENALPDNHVTILRSSTLDPVFASFYLNSPAGQMQVEMHQRGTSGQLELYPFDIRKFLIWEAPESVQKEIRKLYDRGAAAEAKSKQLLAEAKARVEQLIEEAVAK
jgi:restriction endonuclease S subunit